MATYTDILGIQNGWATGEPIDDAYLSAVADTLESLLASREEIDLSGNTDVTPDPATVARANVLHLVGVLTGNVALILPAWAGKRWLVHNATSGAYSVTLKVSGGTGVTLTQGYGCEVFGDGTDILRRGVETSGSTARLATTILAGVVSSPPATVQNLTSSATITLPTGGHTKRLSASGGAVTGIILTAGTVDGQELVLFNIEASNTITFATAATSNVADGTSAVIGALRRMALTWDATSSRWYRSG